MYRETLTQKNLNKQKKIELKKSTPKEKELNE
jgi:hypothetical protein